MNSTTTFYRLCIWLPLALPVLLIVVVNIFGLRDLVGWVGELVAFSLLYGGIPYLALAIWATWWVDASLSVSWSAHPVLGQRLPRSEPSSSSYSATPTWASPSC